MMRWRRRKKQFALAILSLTVVAVIQFSRYRKEHGHQDATSYSTQFKLKLFPPRQTTKGFLNVAIWEEICGHQMRSLKEFPLFPHGPSKRLRTSSLWLHFPQELEDFGLRIFGFLSPKETGKYNFYVASSGTSELWISADSKPENSKLIVNTTAELTSWKNKDNTNRISMVVGERYYVEILHKNGPYDGENLNHVHVTWSSSSWKDHEPSEIPSDVFIAYEIDSNGFDHVRTLNRDTGVVLPIHVEHSDPSFVNEKVKHRAEMYLLPFINESDSKDLFPPCQYNPSYIVKGPLKRYQSTWEMHYTSIYPFDYTDVVEEKPLPAGNFVHLGNEELEENTAQAIVSQVWAQIQRKLPG